MTAASATGRPAVSPDRRIGRWAARITAGLGTRSGLAAVLLLAALVFGVELATQERRPASISEGWFGERAYSLLRFGNWWGTMWPDVNERQAGVFGIGKTYFGALAISFRLFGVGLWQSRLVSLLFGVVAAGLVYRLGCGLFDRAAGGLAALILLVNRGFQATIDDGRPDLMILAFALLSLLLLIRYERTRRPLTLCWAGLVGALTLDLHLNALPVPVALLAAAGYLVVTRRLRTWELLPLLAGCALAFVCWYLANIAIYDPAYFITTVLGAAASDGGSWGWSLLTDKAAWAYDHYFIQHYGWNALELALMVLAVPAIAGWRRLEANERLLVVWLAAFIGSGTVYVKTFADGYLMIFIPVLYLLLARWFTRLARLANRSAGQTLFLALLMAALVIYGGRTVAVSALELRRAPESGRRFSRLLAELQRHIPPDAVVLGQPAYWFGFTDQQYYPGQFYLSRVGSETDELVNDAGHLLSDAERLEKFTAFLHRRRITHLIDCRYFGAALRRSYTPEELPLDQFELLGTVEGIRLWRVRPPVEAVRP